MCDSAGDGGQPLPKNHKIKSVFQEGHFCCINEANPIIILQNFLDATFGEPEDVEDGGRNILRLDPPSNGEC